MISSPEVLRVRGQFVRLMAQAGAVATLRAVTEGAYDPVQGTVTNVPDAVGEPVRLVMMHGADVINDGQTIVERRQALVPSAGITAIAVNDEIDIDARAWRVSKEPIANVVGGEVVSFLVELTPL